MFLRMTDPVPRVVIRESCQDVQMLSIDRGTDHFDLIALKFFDDGLNDKRAEMRRDADGVALHEGFGEFEEVIEFSLGRRIPVVAIAMFAVMSGTPTARVASQP